MKYILVASALLLLSGAVLAPLPAQTLGGCAMFPANNIWNTPIDTLPVSAFSAAYISSIGPSTGLHPDFGSGTWDGGPIGIPYALVTGNQPKVAVSFDYADESDPGPYPIPASAPIEGGSGSSGDRHVLLVDTTNCILYELYAAYPQPDGTWQAGSGAIFELTGDHLRPQGWTSADAAGLPILPGLVRYDEILAGKIDHAIRFTVQVTQKAYLWPARHYASSHTSTSLPPMGTRFRLKSAFNVSGFPPEVQIILNAMKKYGIIVADNGSNWFISGVPDERWNNDHLATLGNVKGSDFEAVDESGLMLEVNSASVSPAISRLKPGSTAPGGAAFTLAVNGTGFVSGAAVMWNRTALSTSHIGTTQLTASVPATLTASAGTASVTVVNPGGAPSAAATFGINLPTAAFRDVYGAIQLVPYPSSTLHGGGGLFAGDPGAAQGAAGDTFVAARDTYNSLWASVFSASNQTWGAWSFAGGLIEGRPGIAVTTNGTAYIAVRDAWNSYWITSYTTSSGFGAWTYLAGIFAGDPVMAAALDGSVYLIGKDNWGSLWSGQYIPASGFQGWQYGGGIIKGNPSVTVGTDGVAYVAVRDNWNSLWIARVKGSSWLGWSYGGGIMSNDPQVAAAGNGTIYTVLLDSGNVAWCVGYTEGASSGWQSWTQTGGVLASLSPAALGGVLYIAGQDSNDKLWWYRSTDRLWTSIGNQGVATGALAAAPR